MPNRSHLRWRWLTACHGPAARGLVPRVARRRTKPRILCRHGVIGSFLHDSVIYQHLTQERLKQALPPFVGRGQSSFQKIAKFR